MNSDPVPPVQAGGVRILSHARQKSGSADNFFFRLEIEIQLHCLLKQLQTCYFVEFFTMVDTEMGDYASKQERLYDSIQPKYQIKI